MMKKYLKYQLSAESVISKLLLVLMCGIHEFTKYTNCRSIGELFYWPEGFWCWDMVVVVLFLSLGVWIVYRDGTALVRCMGEDMK